MAARRGGADPKAKFQWWQGEARRAIIKQGNRYIRKMLVTGATSVLRVAGKRKGALADWINALRARMTVAVRVRDKL